MSAPDRSLLAASVVAAAAPPSSPRSRSPRTPRPAPPPRAAGTSGSASTPRRSSLKIDPATNKVARADADRLRLLRARLRRRLALDRGHELEHRQPRLGRDRQAHEGDPGRVQPYDATFAYGSAWATSHGSGEVERIDPARNKVVKRWKLADARPARSARSARSGRPGSDGVDPHRPGVAQGRRDDPDAGRRGWTAASSDAVWVTTRDGVDAHRPGDERRRRDGPSRHARARRPRRRRRAASGCRRSARTRRPRRPGHEHRHRRPSRSESGRSSSPRSAARPGSRAGRAATSGGSSPS